MTCRCPQRMCHYLIATVRSGRLIGHRAASQETDIEDRPWGPTTNHAHRHTDVSLHWGEKLSHKYIHIHTHRHTHIHWACRPIHYLREFVDRKSFLVLCSFTVFRQIKSAPNLIPNSTGSVFISSALLFTLFILFFHTCMNPLRTKRIRIIQVHSTERQNKMSIHTDGDTQRCSKKKLLFRTPAF